MSESCHIKLTESAILKVPFDMYEKDYTFIVNGKEFPICRFFADLISPKISQLHSIDPTSTTFIITTQESGDFSQFLNLINFNQNTIPESELPFISEVIQILNSDSIEVYHPDNFEGLTIYNVFERIEMHEKNEKFFKNQLQTEIEFLSSHFYEINEEEEMIVKLSQLRLDTLDLILNYPNLRLKTEDQLLKVINSIYSIKRSYFQLYEYIQFENVDSHDISEFLDLFNIDDLTNETWKKLSFRLQQKSIQKVEQPHQRYKFNKTDLKLTRNISNSVQIPFNSENQLNGIINFLRSQSNEDISKKVVVTASSIGNSLFPPSNVIEYDTDQLYFYTKNSANSWIRFDFKDRKVAPKSYTIRTDMSSDYHPKNWVLEGSNDKEKWVKIDVQSNCSFTNGRNLTHAFEVENGGENGFRYLQVRTTGKNWLGHNLLDVGAIEFHGTLI